ncbi:MAG: CPBP family intramembrane glutamic endopeptidase [Halobacteriaceae archaeon]
MVEPAWQAFTGLSVLVALALVGLARLSQGGVPTDAEALGSGHAASPRAVEGPADPDVSTGALLVNVALSQGVFGAVLLVGAWVTRVPPAALGAGPGWLGLPALAAGVAGGLALYLGDESLAWVADRLGAPYSEAIRDLLAPDSATEWAVLLLGVLPVIAGFEELLFRGALVGAVAAGVGVSPWVLAGASSALFGFAHGAQGPAGMVVTGLLGFALAALFVLTGSLAAAVLAHYLVDALEFLANET